MQYSLARRVACTEHYCDCCLGRDWPCTLMSQRLVDRYSAGTCMAQIPRQAIKSYILKLKRDERYENGTMVRGRGCLLYFPVGKAGDGPGERCGVNPYYESVPFPLLFDRCVCMRLGLVVPASVATC